MVEVEHPQPILAEKWDALIPMNFELPLMVMFDGKSDPHEHVTTFNMKINIIGQKSLK